VTPSSPAPADWTLDPVERARFLDGEGSPAERAAREARLREDPVARARLDREERFLALVRRAAEAQPPCPPGLLDRVRGALAADRDAPPEGRVAPVLRFPARRVGIAAAAAAAAFALWAGVHRPRETEASEEARLAAAAARRARAGVLPGPSGATCEEGVASPYRFPLVARGELAIAGCRPLEEGASVSVLTARGGMADSRGLVTTRSPAAGAPTGRAPDVGVLALDDMVVFDVSIGGARYHLAAPRETVDRLGSCAACHGTSREGQENPHRFVPRE
jgi:hypothetical protein